MAYLFHKPHATHDERIFSTISDVVLSVNPMQRHSPGFPWTDAFMPRLAGYSGSSELHIQHVLCALANPSKLLMIGQLTLPLQLVRWLVHVVNVAACLSLVNRFVSWLIRLVLIVPGNHTTRIRTNRAAIMIWVQIIHHVSFVCLLVCILGLLPILASAGAVS